MRAARRGDDVAAKSHKEVEFHVDVADGSTRIFKTFDEAAGLAIAVSASNGKSVNIDVVIFGEHGAKWYGGDDGLEQFLEDPDASVYDRIVVTADSQGRVR